jgi:nitroreductase/NAD-dependent dihydropyrimidine dehydrogenase PreA subunit
MAIPTSRTDQPAEVIIDMTHCTLCGNCVTVCKDFSLEIIEDKIVFGRSPLFGCIGCGQCEAVCPHDCISVIGRTLAGDDFFSLPAKEESASLEQLLNLMNRRRSVRDFRNKEVEQDVIDNVLKAAMTAPMGLPPSDVEVLVLQGNDKVRAFSNDVMDYFKSIGWIFSPFMLTLMRPFYGKEAIKLMRGFITPLLGFMAKARKEGKNYLLYDAPVAFYFYGTPYCDPADPQIACTYAMLAAESLGLGTCMIGSVGPFIQKGAYKLKKKYGIHPRNQMGLMLIMGYPKLHYKKTIRRSFAKVNRY